jgi:ASC-1-like (ASCH) protein
MKRITSNKQEPYFSYIRDGVKTVEGRLCRDKWESLEPRDEILVTCVERPEEQILVQVVRTEKYKTFAEMIGTEGYQNVIPDAKNTEEAAAEYYKFYSKEDEAKFGVVGLEIRPCAFHQ